MDKSNGPNSENLPTDNAKLLFRPKKDKTINMAGLAPIDEEDDEEWLKEARDAIELQRGVFLSSRVDNNE